MRLTALGTQHGTRDQGVIDHKYDRIEGYLDQQGDDPQLQELPCGERAVEGERQVQPVMSATQADVNSTNRRNAAISAIRPCRVSRLRVYRT